MKVIDIPSSGKRGMIVAYLSPFGQIHRAVAVAKDVRTPARERQRRDFAQIAQAWCRVLTQAQRQAWNVAGPTARSATRLGSGPLTGQMLFEGLNCARFCIGQRTLMVEPPAPVLFGRNPVGQLIITNGENGVRLLLEVTGPVTEEIMVFGQAPCSAGRMKRRNVAYLGLPPAPEGGLIDITELYIARYGEPRVGDKVFIVTRQQKDGWEGHDQETNEIVPGKPSDQQAVTAGALTLQVYMHKGCTKDAQGIASQAVPEPQGSNKGAAKAQQAAFAALDGSAGATEDVGSPVCGGRIGLDAHPPSTILTHFDGAPACSRLWTPTNTGVSW